MARKLTYGEIERELRRIAAMKRAANKAKAFTRLLWRCRRWPDDAGFLFDYPDSGRHRRPKPVWDRKVWRRESPPWHLVGDEVEVELRQLFWDLKYETYTPSTWWRQKRLTLELQKAQTGKGFVAELTKMFQMQE